MFVSGYFDLDIRFEPDAGRNSVDFKVSHGGNEAIVEIKLFEDHFNK